MSGSIPQPPQKQNTHMKTIITSIALIMAITTHAQVSIDGGIITRGASVTVGVNYQKNLQLNHDAPLAAFILMGTSIARDNFWPTSSIMVGIGTNKYEDDPGWLRGNIILSAGPYWHTGIWEDGYVEKLKQKGRIFLGVSLQYQHDYNVPIKIAWDGKTTHLTIAWLF